MASQNQMKNKKMSVGKKVAIGAGVAAFSAAGAGAYYLLGPNKKAHQKKAAVLVAKIKKEVAHEIKKVKVVTLPVYHRAVDIVSENYAKQYKIHEGDIKSFAKKLKSEWGKTKKVVKKAANRTKKKIT